MHNIGKRYRFIAALVHLDGAEDEIYRSVISRYYMFYDVVGYLLRAMKIYYWESRKSRRRSRRVERKEREYILSKGGSMR